MILIINLLLIIIMGPIIIEAIVNIICQKLHFEAILQFVWVCEIISLTSLR